MADGSPDWSSLSADRRSFLALHEVRAFIKAPQAYVTQKRAAPDFESATFPPQVDDDRREGK
jgi:hypothetical protein